MDGDGKLVSFKVVLGGKPLLSWFTIHVSKESITFLEALEILRDASTVVDSTVHLRGEFPKEFPLPPVFVGETLASAEKMELEVLPSLPGLRTVRSRGEYVRFVIESVESESEQRSSGGDVRCAFAALRAGAKRVYGLKLPQKKGVQSAGEDASKEAPIRGDWRLFNDLLEARALGFTNGVDNSDLFLFFFFFLLVCLFFSRSRIDFLKNLDEKQKKTSCPYTRFDGFQQRIKAGPPLRLF